MTKIKTMLAALAVSAMTLSSSAYAQDGRRDRNPYNEQRRGADTGTVVAVGAAGLVLGAIIAGSNNNRKQDRAYEEGYNDGRNDGDRYERNDRYDRRDRYDRYDRYRGGYAYGEYYYVPRGYYYRDRYYSDGGYGYRYYRRGR